MKLRQASVIYFYGAEINCYILLLKEITEDTITKHPVEASTVVTIIHTNLVPTRWTTVITILELAIITTREFHRRRTGHPSRNDCSTILVVNVG